MSLDIVVVYWFLNDDQDLDKKRCVGEGILEKLVDIDIMLGVFKEQQLELFDQSRKIKYRINVQLIDGRMLKL